MYDTLVLDKTGRPVDFIPPERAIVLCWLGRAVVLLEWPEKIFHSQDIEVAAPKVIALKVYVPLPDRATKVVTNTILFARDNYTCQYCGRHVSELGKKEKLTLGKKEKLTRDHVKPVSKHSGKNRSEKKLKANAWENVVTACTTCNSVKADRTPVESGMMPLRTPKRPHGVVMTFATRVKDKEQRKFLEPYMKGAMAL